MGARMGDDQGEHAAVGWTCPGLDALALIVKRYVDEPDCSRALLLIEEQRRANLLLRAAAAARRASASEVQRIDERIAAMLERRRL